MDSQVHDVVGRYGPNTREVLLSLIENRREDFDVIEESVLGVLQKIKAKAESLIPFLAVISASAPLLGLLGTVIGMIKTFALITVLGTGEAKSLSSGISEALVTTEFGLIVAIPTLILHGFLSRKAKEQVHEYEDMAANVVVELRKNRKRDVDVA